MSKGKVVRPKGFKLSEDSLTKGVQKNIMEIVDLLEVDVEDTYWQESDKVLKDEIHRIQDSLAQLKDAIGDNKTSVSDHLKSLEVEINDLKLRKPLDLIVTLSDTSKVDLGLQHFQLPSLITILSTKLNVYLVGPAGSGKTHAAVQCAEALGIDFYFTGAVASEFKLTGFIDANGKIVNTEFRKAYEFGGLFLFDEIDGSYPQAVLAFNAALSNDYMDFPDKRVERHENFYCIAAANTYGQGADRQYVGRNQLDAASLDRFVFLDWGYDVNLERTLAGNNEWTDYVQKIRRYVFANKIRHIVSPRASIFGAKLLAAKMSREHVESYVLWKGIDTATKQQIIGGLDPVIDVNLESDGTFKSNFTVNKKVKQGQVLGIIEGYYSSNKVDVISPVDGVISFIEIDKRMYKGSVIVKIKTYT